MLLLPLSCDGVLVSEDEVDLVGRTTLIGAEHDCEGSLGKRRLESANPTDSSDRLAKTKTHLVGVVLTRSKALTAFVLCQ